MGGHARSGGLFSIQAYQIMARAEIIKSSGKMGTSNSSGRSVQELLDRLLVCFSLDNEDFSTLLIDQ